MKSLESLTQVVKLADLLIKSKRITVLTGAGISTDSGIPDFRSTESSIWVANKTREQLMSTSYLNSHPKDFWPIYQEIFCIKINNEFKPNYGHIFLKELEDIGKDVKIFTQNVDGLHIDAGSSYVREVHGTIKSATCPKCGKKFNISYVREHEIPRCDRLLNAMDRCNFILHPDVVLFGGSVHHYKEADKHSKSCDLMLIIGTSLNVSPFNMLPLNATGYYSDAKVAIINRDPTDFDEMFDIVIHDSITDTLKTVKGML